VLPRIFCRMPSVHYLAIGHFAKDVTPDGHRLGGSVAYSALTAHALGYAAGIVTAGAQDVDVSALNEVAVQRVPSAHSTTFQNQYYNGARTQHLLARAEALQPNHIPLEWMRAPIVHLAPLAVEFEPADFLLGFENAFVGLTGQGMLRAWDEAGRVRRAAWPNALAALPHTSATIISIEDVNGDWAEAERWAKASRVLVVTEGKQGCTVFVKGEGARQFSAPSMNEMDPTGAGDIFAAAFFIHLYETGDVWAAARLANHLAANSITRVGLAGVPTVDEVGLARMQAEQS
jgi:sugar/nucleoside kinase (ribokinase family)